MTKHQSYELEEFKKQLIERINERAESKTLPQNNAELLCNLIRKAESNAEASAIMALGMKYNKTGLVFEHQQERVIDSIPFLKRNGSLSFPCTKEGGVTHKLIIGENYQALLNLRIQYKERISVIYIDPPYGRDSMGEFAKTNYDNNITRDNLLSMLYSRLNLAKELLAPEGAIFCSIDDKNQAYVKCLMDDIFGENNFIGNIIWRKKSGGGQTDEFFVTEHEYILSYRKSENFKWIDFNVEANEQDFKYDDKDGKGKYSITKLEKWGSEAHMEDRPTMYFPIKNPDGNDFYPIAPDKTPGRWRIGENRMKELIKNNEIHWEKNDETNRWTPYEKNYLSKSNGKLLKCRSILYNIAETGTATKLLTSIFGKKDIFDNPKPIEILNTIFKHIKCDTVLDFFAGSGTTAHAVMELNKQDGGKRQCILCQLNETTDSTPNGIAYDVTSKRLKRIATGECYDGSKDFKWAGENTPYGDGLEVYEIATVPNTYMQDRTTPYDEIDETAYGKEKFNSFKDKMEWICKKFSHTMYECETEAEYSNRIKKR